MIKRKTKGTLILLLAFAFFLLGFVSACNYCGDGAVNQLTEECDWGTSNGFLCWAGYGSSCDYCTNSCKLKTITNYCGDGILNSACEECDDGNIIDEDGCSSQCEIEEPTPYCGDGICNGDETCSTCAQDCGICPPEPPVCGNGILETGEECDDGNTANGDGCSFLCETEEPTLYCGDGICNGDETCSTCAQDCGVCPPKKTTLQTTKINWEQFCEVNWQCSGWSECNENGFMTRKCYDTNHCSFSYNKPLEITGCELQKVLVEEEDKTLLWVMMGTSLVLLLILVLLMRFRKG